MQSKCPKAELLKSIANTIRQFKVQNHSRDNAVIRQWEKYDEVNWQRLPKKKTGKDYSHSHDQMEIQSMRT